MPVTVRLPCSASYIRRGPVRLQGARKIAPPASPAHRSSLSPGMVRTVVPVVMFRTVGAPDPHSRTWSPTTRFSPGYMYWFPSTGVRSPVSYRTQY